MRYPSAVEGHQQRHLEVPPPLHPELLGPLDVKEKLGPPDFRWRSVGVTRSSNRMSIVPEEQRCWSATVSLGADDGIRTRDPHLGNAMGNVYCDSTSLTNAPELRVFVSPVSSVSPDRWSGRDFVGDSLVSTPVPHATGRPSRYPKSRILFVSRTPSQPSTPSSISSIRSTASRPVRGVE
jgi:hypothetical protein